jgi:hypothetical protein
MIERLHLKNCNPKAPPLTHKTTCIAFTGKKESLYGGDVRKVTVESKGNKIDFGIMKVVSKNPLFDDVVEIIMQSE